MADTGIDDWSKYESGTDPFTAAELEAIHRYREFVADMPDDTFEGFDADRILSDVAEHGASVALANVEGFTNHLNGWWGAISMLKDALSIGADGYSTAAHRYVGHLTAQHRNACARFERAVTMWFLDFDPGLSSPLYLKRDADE
ncbi:hypothetical protein [Actinacidiphila sp. bgisy160]|uniref:hypothetical protein n=1 Tax=Actinacidiphila sp. bgisy160 TaxID=3413796 RepID=UPI003D7281E8